MPKAYLPLFEGDATDDKVYSGKGYFIDHAVNHHANVPVSEYDNIQVVLDHPDSIKKTASGSIAFIKKLNQYDAVLVDANIDENGRILLHKTFFSQKKEPYAKEDDIRPENMSREGGASSISHADSSAPAISLESRRDNGTEPASNNGPSSTVKDSESSGTEQGKSEKVAEGEPRAAAVAEQQNGGQGVMPAGLQVRKSDLMKLTNMKGYAIGTPPSEIKVVGVDNIAEDAETGGVEADVTFEYPTAAGADGLKGTARVTKRVALVRRGQEPYKREQTKRGERKYYLDTVVKKDGERVTTTRVERDGKEIVSPNAYFPMPEGYEADPEYLGVFDDDDADDIDVLGIHELRELKDGRKIAAVVIKGDGAFCTLEGVLLRPVEPKQEKPKQKASEQREQPKETVPDVAQEGPASVQQGAGAQGDMGGRGVDAQGNPVDITGRLVVEKVGSVDELTDGDFTAPTRTVQLPKIPENVNRAIGAGGKPVIIKKNIFEKNRDAHKELSPSDSREILTLALYTPDLAGSTQPIRHPDYKVAIHTGEKNSVIVLDVYSGKDNVEIVGWRKVDEKGLEKMKKQATREGGQLLILSPASRSAAALSALPNGASSAGKGSEKGGGMQEHGKPDVEAVKEKIAEIERLDKLLEPLLGEDTEEEKSIEGKQREATSELERLLMKLSLEQLEELGETKGEWKGTSLDNWWVRGVLSAVSDYKEGQARIQAELDERAEVSRQIEPGKPQKKVSPMDFSYVDNGEERGTSNAVYHDGGFVVGTNGHIIYARREDYPAELEGKRTDKKGETTGGRLPKTWREILPTGEQTEPFEASIDGLHSFVAGVRGADKSKDALVAIRLPNGRVVMYNAKGLDLFLRAAKASKAEVRLTCDDAGYKRDSLSFHTDDAAGMIMPHIIDADRVYAYIDNTWVYDARGRGGGVQEHKVTDEGGAVERASAEERLKVEALAEKLNGMGIATSTDWEQGQHVLDMEKEKAQLNKENKKALETASLGTSPRSLTVISSADGAKVLNDLDNLAEKYENSATQPKTFVGQVAKALGISEKEIKDRSSQYKSFETKNGKIITIRLSNHNATPEKLANNGQYDAISIVITNKPNKGMAEDGTAHVVEYYYDAIKLRKAEGKPLAEIVRSIKQALYSGEFKDTTGLAERQEVNIDGQHGSGVQFFRTADGKEAYGFTVGGRIYIDPRIATAATPVHEYAHLWSLALERANPEAWEHLKAQLMHDKELLELVRGKYPDIKGENELMHEVFAHYGGRRGKERIDAECEREKARAHGVIDKARVVAAFERLKDLLTKFWTMARDLFAGDNARLKEKSADDFADMMVADLLGGFDPRKVKSEAKNDGGVKLNKEQKRDAEKRIDERMAELHRENGQSLYPTDGNQTVPPAKAGNLQQEAGRNGVAHAANVTQNAELAKKLADFVADGAQWTDMTAQDFASRLAAAIGKRRHGQPSVYADFQSDGERVRMRVSDHRGNARNIILKGSKSSRGISIVIFTPYSNKAVKFKGRNSLNFDVVEYVYDNPGKETLRKIAKGLFAAVDAGTYIDFAGAQEVNDTQQYRDKVYEQAVSSGDTEAAVRMLEQKAKENGYLPADYQGSDSWSAPMAEVEEKDFDNLGALQEALDDYGAEANIYGIINGVQGHEEDYYFNPSRAGFSGQAASETAQVLRRLRAGRASADTKIKVYRVVPNDIKGDNLMQGDWVALSKTYCEELGKNKYGEGRYRIIESDVPIKYLWQGSEDMREFGYDDGKKDVEKNVKNNRKLLEITYDDQGRLIPLSERFNPRSSDIRYQFAGEKGAAAGMGDGGGTFQERQRKAVANKGTVMPGLTSAEVAVVEVPRHDFTGTGKQAINKAKAWAEQHLVGLHTAHRIDGNTYEYNIDNDAVGKFLSSSSTLNSDNLGVHLAVLKKLPEVIDNSIEAEEHPDYKKVSGERRAENGVGDNNLLVHRMYGAVKIDGKLYRVKTTMHEHLSKGNAPHDYRVTKIELLISGSSTSNALSNSNGSHNLSMVTAAKLLEGVEKSYDKGKKILDESAKADAVADGDTRGYTTTEGEGYNGGSAARADVEQAVADVDKRTAQQDETLKHRTAEQLSAKLNTPMRIVEDVEEITHSKPEVQERRRQAKGWYAEIDKDIEEANVDEDAEADDDVLFRDGEEEDTFKDRQSEAVSAKGVVMPGLNSASVNVVKLDDDLPFDVNKKTRELKDDVVSYALSHDIIGTMTEDETHGKGQIKISKKSISKMVDDSATNKSVDKKTHLSVIPKLREIIAESAMTEFHPDYKKGENGVRGPENGYNPDNLIYRCYGAVRRDGRLFRIKLTLKETSGDKLSKKAYSYEVTKIEVLDGQTIRPEKVLSRNSSTSNGVGTPNNHLQAYPLAKLLKGVEKSYEPGKKILDESENLSTDEENSNGELVKFRYVQGGPLLDFLNGQPTRKGYRYAQWANFGVLPPMTAKVDGEWRPPMTFGQWEQSKEGMRKANGKADLVQGNGRTTGNVAYNPYFHIRTSPLNDQFTAAYDRPELVVVEGEYPESELTSGYRAPGAKNSVGLMDWHSGSVNGQLSEGTKVQTMLSRYFKPKRIVPWGEVADLIMERVGKQKITFPINVLPPMLRAELAKRGAKFGGVSGTVTTKDRAMLDDLQKRVNAGEWDAGLDKANAYLDAYDSSDEAKAARVEQISAQLGTPIKVVSDPEEIGTLPSRRKRMAKGWYDEANDEVVVMLPNNRDAEDVAATVMHETVAHKGLSEMIGEENYDEFLDQVHDHLTDELKKEVDERTSRAFLHDVEDNGARAKSREEHQRREIDELLGRLAEKGFEDFDAGERTVWRRIKEVVRRVMDKFLGSLKLPSWFRLGDNELRYMLWRSKERLEHGREHPIDVARDVVKREELGLSDDAIYNMGEGPDTFKARQRRAVEQKGTVAPGLNSAEIKVVDVPRHSYTGSIADATRQVAEAVKAKYAPDGKPKPLHYDNHGEEFDYTILGSAIDESLNPKQQAKSDSKGVHLAVVEHLDEVINNSIEAEEHPDYIKNSQGERDTHSVNADALMHRFYGAIKVDGKVYRVMTLMREDRNAGNGVHAYEVTKVKVLDEKTPSTSSGSRGVNSGLEPRGLISVAKLLQNVEKAYDKGKYLLDESKKADENTALYRDPGESGGMVPRREEIDWDGAAGKEELAQHLAQIPTRVGIKARCVTVAIGDEAEMKRLRGVVEDELMEAIEKRFHNPLMLGVSDPWTGMVIIFTDRQGSRREAESTWWHERSHIAWAALEVPDKEELGRAALEWLKDNDPKHYDRLPSTTPRNSGPRKLL